MPAAPAFSAPVKRTCRSKCSSARRRGARPGAVPATAGGVVVLAPRVPARAMSVSRAMATISAERGDELDGGERGAVDAGQPQQAQASTASSAQKRGWRPPIGRRIRLPSGGRGGRAVAVGEPGAAGVVVGDEDDAPGLSRVAPGDDVLRGAPAEQAAHGGEQQAGVEEGEQGGRQGQGGAGDRHETARTLAPTAAAASERVGERPGGVDRERLDLGGATECLEPLVEVHGGAPLGVAAGARRPRSTRASSSAMRSSSPVSSSLAP